MPRLTGPLKFRSFWPRTTWQWSPIPHTHPIWPPVTLSSSPSWSFGWRVEDSTPLKRFKRNRSGYLTQFQKGTSRDASNHGRNAGTAVFVQKGSTLKVMEEFNIQGKQTCFYKYYPGTFGYILVLPVTSVSAEIHRKLKVANRNSPGLRKQLKSHWTVVNTKIKLYTTFARPVVLCGCETWASNESDGNNIRVFERSFEECKWSNKGKWRMAM